MESTLATPQQAPEVTETKKKTKQKAPKVKKVSSGKKHELKLAREVRNTQKRIAKMEEKKYKVTNKHYKSGWMPTRGAGLTKYLDTLNEQKKIQDEKRKKRLTAKA